MDAAIPDKEFFRIGEVGKILGVDPYVVRFWESEFKSVKPVRTSSDQRLYRRKDVEQLLIIRKLLYTDKFTIQGAKQQLLKVKSEEIQDRNDRHLEVLIEIKKGLKVIRDIVS
jgi:DNA-binding transcriptional MerR regulator